MKDRFAVRWHGIEVGGAASLDFANTLDWRLRDQPVELLSDYAELLRWGWSARVMTLAEATQLREWAATHARIATRSLERARSAREAMAALFQAKVLGAKLPADPLQQLEDLHRSALAARCLRSNGSNVEWIWRASTPEPDRVTWAAVLDAIELLRGADAQRIRQCGDAACGWFFLDTSRNRSRRWCSMQACGNRNKVRSFYRRQQP